MAKSIFETLDTLQTETSVPSTGKSIEHTLPRAIFPTAEQFESAEKLLAWSNEHGFTHALLQAGIQKGLIDVRATFKACKKDDTWTASYGQANVDKMTWTITERSKTGNKVETAIDTLSKLSPEQLAEIMKKIQEAQFQQPK